MLPVDLLRAAAEPELFLKRLEIFHELSHAARRGRGAHGLKDNETGLSIAAAPARAVGSGVEQHGNHQKQRVYTGNRISVINHPGVDDSGDGQENETEQRNYEAVIRPLQVAAEKKHQNQNDPRKKQDH